MGLSWTRENDHIRWPFLYARDSHKGLTLMLSSGSGMYGTPGATIRLSAWGHTLMVAVPQCLVRPAEGRYEPEERECGFYVSEGHFVINYGRQTMDSSTTQSKGWFLPWTQWRFISESHLDFDGQLIRRFPDKSKWRDKYEFEQSLPTMDFEFDDFDGERITAKTRIEERHWKFGEGWFKWLSLFVRDKVSRSLDIAFTSEVGDRKGSWKGGTVGHAIEMESVENVESAFRRYCGEHNMTFVGHQNKSD